MSTIDLRPMTADGGNAEPGWYPDPVRRFPHRYWDGQYWTARVGVGGACHDDPIGSGLNRPNAPTWTSCATTWSKRVGAD